MRARPIKRIDSSRRAENASARLESRPSSLDTLQQEKRPPHQRDTLKESGSEDALRDGSGSRRRDVIEGESWSQAIDLTGDWGSFLLPSGFGMVTWCQLHDQVPQKSTKALPI